jgi:hypothetical protein
VPIGRQFAGALKLMNGVNDLRPKISSMKIPPVNAPVEPVHRNKDRPKAVFLNQFSCRTLNGGEHSVTLLPV